ncbi:orotidine 5-phosphate decarboxylase [Sulfitobacter sp. F26169L]|uniref:orotidine 5-phosphate decarboxylase n=1 Tax=Sulfitobacter sp. F26169L TaxID=2996015 RepID=UPI002260C50E|nr:orotidine 5-phosphate decarboxylase [Sulfitobacter sp. F26169L]MCX7565576.1 orotidine 5-phosphate decarboxylase [Sulfitobacter sp. F26169L]
MTQTTIQMSDVIYNASTQCFEALVTVNKGQSAVKYPCAIEAPITMSFEDAAKGLSKQALRRNKSKNSLYSQIRNRAPHLRAVRPRFDPRVWLAQLGFSSSDQAA